MNRRESRAGWVGIVAALLAAATLSSAGAQTRPLTIEEDCDGDALARFTADQLGREAYERTPNRAWARLTLLNVAQEFRAMGDSALAYFDSLGPEPSAPATQTMRRRLQMLRDELARTERDLAFRTAEGPSASPFEIAAGGDDTPWWIGARGMYDTVTVDSATPAPTRRALCWGAMFARRIADAGGVPAREKTRQVLAGRQRRWENFERSGYSLTPLELLVNGWCGACRDELEPPRAQIILGHLLPAYVVRNGSGSRAAIAAELGGLLFYSSSRSFHWGASIVVAYPQEERREVGVLLHVSSIGQLGITSPSWAFATRRSSVLLSADLYRFIESWRGRLRDERDAVRRGAGKLGL